MNANSADPMIGRLIDGRYQVRSRIARGGMATVYLATDLRLERRVAIKIMHGHLADDSKFKERFIQEARSAARLAHPNVVNVYDQGQDSDMAYLVMEYLPGITLRDLMQEHGRLTSEQTLDVLEAVLSGLAAAHKAGIVHRDLKPENVLLADDGRIKIGDFGLARAASANTATGQALLGTIAYLSPELVTRGIADTRSDIYAVGIMMYEMLTGEQPFKGEQPMQIAYQHANDSVPTPSTKNPRVPAELDELVLWATAREPDERPRDARVMLEQLQATQSLLQTALPTKTTAIQRTMRFPTGPTSPVPTGGTAETQVLGGVAREATGPVFSDSTALLAQSSRRRHARGWWLFALVLLLAGVAGGTGWYFGTGPGSKSVVPSVSKLSVETARTTLTKAGFHVNTATTSAYDVAVAENLVSATSPASGASVPKGASITLILSRGPRPLPMPTLVGLGESAAKAAILAAHFTVRDPSIQQFDSKVAKGTVLGALDSGGASLVGAKSYLDSRPIRLIVSAGAIPDVSGDTIDAATAALTSAGLSVGSSSATEYNDTVPSGQVIRAQLVNGAKFVRTGGTVDLVVSKGIEQVAVPNVIGMTIPHARNVIEKAGLKVADTGLPGFLPGAYRVSSTNPDAGTMVDKGSVVTITGFVLG